MNSFIFRMNPYLGDELAECLHISGIKYKPVTSDAGCVAVTIRGQKGQ